MNEQQEVLSPCASAPSERYSIVDAEAQRRYIETRRAATWVGFFLPHLRPGMRVLDCGCGVGSITLDLAELVAPGQVIGIDLDPTQLDIARAMAAQRGLANVQFIVASVYDLPFAEGSFDAVLAHTLLMHLRDPLQILRTLRRMVKAGGVIGVSDDDLSTVVVSPPSALADLLVAIWPRVVEANGGSPFYSRHLRQLLLEAGFVRTEGHAVAADYHGALDATRRFARVWEQLLAHTSWTALITGQGWASQEELDELIAWFRAWGERPDAFMAWMYCAAVGWAGD